MAQFPIKNGLIQGTLAGTPTSGTLNLASLTLTLPTVPVAQGGTGAASKPCFSAYASGTTTLTNNAGTKVAFATEDFDVASNYDTGTSRFTAPIAGKYRFSTSVFVTDGSLGAAAEVYFAKNGTKEKSVFFALWGTPNSAGINGTVVMNLAANDYVEVFIYNNGGGSRTAQNYQAYTQFSGELITP